MYLFSAYIEIVGESVDQYGIERGGRHAAEEYPIEGSKVSEETFQECYLKIFSSYPW